MRLFRIVQNKARTSDLSGTGAALAGGRWNSKGTYMLYTSENSSLAYLECLVHFDPLSPPISLFIMQLEISDPTLIYELPDAEYPVEWLKLGLVENQALGDKLMSDKKYLGIRIRSAINTGEYNVLLNPEYLDYLKHVKIINVKEIEVDERLVS